MRCSCRRYYAAGRHDAVTAASPNGGARGRGAWCITETAERRTHHEHAVAQAIPSGLGSRRRRHDGALGDVVAPGRRRRQGADPEKAALPAERRVRQLRADAHAGWEHDLLRALRGQRRQARARHDHGHLRHAAHPPERRMAGDGRGLDAAGAAARHRQQRLHRSGAADHAGRQDALLHEPAGGRGGADIWMTQKQPDGQWSQAQNVGPNVNSEHVDHCFMPLGLPGEDDTSVFISLRPRENGTPSASDVYTSRMENGAWQPAKRYESKLLDSIGFKCRVNAVARDGLVLGVVSVHDFGKFHRMVFVHYDLATKEWKGPIVDAPFNQANVDGACPMFTAGGDKMIWSAGYDRGPGPVSTSGGTGSTYDLFWLKTSDIVAYYKTKAALA